MEEEHLQPRSSQKGNDEAFLCLIDFTEEQRCLIADSPRSKITGSKRDRGNRSSKSYQMEHWLCARGRTGEGGGGAVVTVLVLTQIQ